MKDVAASEEPSAIEAPDLPAGWTMATVGEVGIVELGRQRSPENHSGPCMRPYLRAANVTWAGIDISDVLEMNFDEADFRRFSLAPGDVLLNEGSGSASEVGKPAIWRGEIVGCCFQNTLLRVRPEACTSEFLERFFYYCAKTRRFVPSTQGVNIFHIGKAGLSRFPMPLPPLPEQPRILAKLDRLSERSRAARDHLGRIAKLAARAKQAILAAATSGALTADWRDTLGRPYSWPTVELGDVAISFNYGTAAKSAKEGAVPVLRMGNIQDGRIVWSDLVYTSDPAEIAQYSLVPGDVLFNRTNSPALVGKTAHYDGFRPAIFAGYLIRIRCGADLVPAFLTFCLNSPDGRAYSWSVKTDGVSQSNINAKKLRAFSFGLPPVDEQREIVRRIEAAFSRIDRLTAEAVRSSLLLERLDERLLAKAFRGELVPQDPTDEPAEALLARIRATGAEAPRPRLGRRARAS